MTASEIAQLKPRDVIIDWFYHQRTLTIVELANPFFTGARIVRAFDHAGTTVHRAVIPDKQYFRVSDSAGRRINGFTKAPALPAGVE